MKKIIALLLLLTVMVVRPGLAADPSAPDETRPKDQGVEKLERRVDELDRQLDRLEQTLKKTRKEAQAEVKKRLPELRQRQQELRKDLDRLQESGQRAWKELEATLKELQKALDPERSAGTVVARLKKRPCGTNAGSSGFPVMYATRGHVLGSVRLIMLLKPRLSSSLASSMAWL